MLGITPPKTFENPVYAIISIFVSVCAFLLVYTKKVRLFRYHGKTYEALLVLADAVGLGTFTVIGVKTAVDVTIAPNAFLFVFMGIMTGVGGGIMRDVLAGSKPYIFVRHVYASACILGSVICVVIYPAIGMNAAMLLGALIVVLVRLAAFRFKWNLPYAQIHEHSA